MIPAGLAAIEPDAQAWLLLVLGFALFMGLEQFLHWHHCQRADATCRKPLTYLILLGDGLHNFIGGLAIASTFLIDIRLGITAWLAAADLIPEVNRHPSPVANVLHMASFLLGAGLMYAAASLAHA